MELWIFDVDGTLTRTNRLDAACYQRAIADYLDLSALEGDWEDFEHPTAAGITRELLAKYGPGSTDGDEIYETVRSAFLDELERAVAEGEEIVEVPGAAELLAVIRSTEGLAGAVATGDWRPSSTFKLERAGIDVEPFPHATSDDAVARSAIIEVAMRGFREDGVEFESVTYVGDGSWDVRAARELGIDFVGVGAGEHAERLREAGAERVVDSPAALLTAEFGTHDGG